MGGPTRTNDRVRDDKPLSAMGRHLDDTMYLSHEILEHLPDAIVVTDERGMVVRWMGSAAQTFGYSASEAIGMPVLTLVHPDFVAQTGAQLARSLRDRGTFTGEIVCVRKDRSTILIEGNAQPVRDRDGRMRFFVGSCRDITERKRADEERSRLFYQQIARTDAEDATRRASFLAGAIAELGTSLDYRATLDKIVRLAVPMMADFAMLDVACDDGTMTTMAIAHRDLSKEPLVQALRAHPDGWGAGPVLRVLRSRVPEMHTTIDAKTLERFVGPPALTEHLSALAFRSALVVPLAVSDASLATLSLFRTDEPHGPKDLSLAEEFAHSAAMALENARLYKNAQEATRLRDEFLGTVSHELRTPLNAVLGWTRMLRAGALGGTSQSRALVTIERNAMLQARLVEDLLDASRIVMGKLRLELRTMDLSSPIRAAIDAVRPAATAKSVTLESSIDHSACFVEGDPNRVQQVVWNLLVNAIKFTPRGGKVELVVVRAGQHARISVRDTGEGIRPEFLPYVFDRFRQADSTTTRRHGGLGMGLALVRHLVELHGGSVRADSAGEGKGSAFTVLLPLSINAAGATSGEALTSKHLLAADIPSLEGLRLLLVDDDDSSRESIAGLLDSCGAIVHGVRSAPDALAALHDVRPDVLIADLGLPGEDGYALIKQLRALEDTPWGALPAIALLARPDAESRVRALMAGYQMHVSKPVDAAELAATCVSLSERTVVLRPSR